MSNRTYRTSPRVLITGASGLLGKAMGKAFSRVAAVSLPPHARSIDTLGSLDVADASTVRKLMLSWRPDIVVHCAAISNAILCNDNPAAAYATNVHGTENIATASRNIGARLFHISTDWVFSGDTENGYVETDEPRPLQYYGLTKLWSEKAALLNDNTCIARVPLLYGGQTGYARYSWPVESVLKLAAGIEVTANGTELRQPALVDDIAYAILRLSNTAFQGIVHVVPEQAITKLNWLFTIADCLGLHSSLIESDWTTVPGRPINSYLRNDLLQSLGVVPPRGVSNTMADFLATLEDRVRLTRR